MPKLMDMDEKTINNSHFGFSATKISHLGASNYTLAHITRDISYSIKEKRFEKNIDLLTKSIILACQKNPRSENVLIRCLDFNTIIEEVHGFKLLSEIDANNDYHPIDANGGTALIDASYSSIGSIINYGTDLLKNYYKVTSCCYILSDGEENSSKMSFDSLKELIEKEKKNEKGVNLTTILIGLTNDKNINSCLKDFKDKSGIDEYVWAGEASEENIARISRFVSGSISSKSNTLNGIPTAAPTF